MKIIDGLKSRIEATLNRWGEAMERRKQIGVEYDVRFRLLRSRGLPVPDEDGLKTKIAQSLNLSYMKPDGKGYMGMTASSIGFNPKIGEDIDTAEKVTYEKATSRLFVAVSPGENGTRMFVGIAILREGVEHRGETYSWLCDLWWAEVEITSAIARHFYGDLAEA